MGVVLSVGGVVQCVEFRFVAFVAVVAGAAEVAVNTVLDPGVGVKVDAMTFVWGHLVPFVVAGRLVHTSKETEEGAGRGGEDLLTVLYNF